MSYLILDTDKQTTHSLRLLLSAISTVPVWDVVNIEAYMGFSRKHPVPAEIIFMDLEGDPAKVKSFEEYFMLKRSTSSALILLGSSPRPNSLLKAERYLQKPVHLGNLKTALVDAQTKTQALRSTVVFYGAKIPGELTREVGRSEKLWKQVLDTASLPDLVNDRTELTQIGAIFISPSQVNEKDVQALSRLKNITSASRISLICLSDRAEEVGKLRNICDYFISPKIDWRAFLDHLAATRLMRLGSALNIDEAKLYLKNGKIAKAQRILNDTIQFAPLKIEALLLSAECDFSNRELGKACAKYQSILSLNPCLPKPYARLLQIETGPSRQATLERAIAYCPGVVEFREVRV
jgi:hypothetical protein